MKKLLRRIMQVNDVAPITIDGIAARAAIRTMAPEWALRLSRGESIKIIENDIRDVQCLLELLHREIVRALENEPLGESVPASRAPVVSAPKPSFESKPVHWEPLLGVLTALTQPTHEQPREDIQRGDLWSKIRLSFRGLGLSS